MIFLITYRQTEGTFFARALKVESWQEAVAVCLQYAKGTDCTLNELQLVDPAKLPLVAAKAQTPEEHLKNVPQ